MVSLGSRVQIPETAPYAGLVKRSNTADCKSAPFRVRRFESSTLHQIKMITRKGGLFYLCRAERPRTSQQSCQRFGEARTRADASIEHVGAEKQHSCASSTPHMLQYIALYDIIV